MKISKSLVCAIALAIASTSIINAQEKKGRGAQTTEQRIERLEQAVGTLTAAQKTKITDIYAKAAAAPQDERMAAMQAAGKDVRAVLTAEQQAKFDAMPQGGKGGGKKKN